MTDAFTFLALACLCYRVWKKRMTRIEWVLFCIWAGHLLLEELQLFAYWHVFIFSPRFTRPADFLLWPWLALGIRDLLSVGGGRLSKAKYLVFLAAALIFIYDAVMLVKPVLPVGRRGAYVEAAKWAAAKIKADWKGPAKDERFLFDVGEYRVSNRPVIDCFTPRVAYLVNGRSNGIDYGKDDEIVKSDRADYWINDLRTDDPPPSDEWELIDTFKRGRYELPLYRRR